MRKTPTSAPPRFCSLDGMVLTVRCEELTRGYDVFSGIELPKSELVTLACQTSGHDVWSLVRHLDETEDVWIKVS